MAEVKKQLNGKQRKFVAALIKGNTKHDAAIVAGYSKSNAGSIARQLLQKQSVAEALNQAGLSDADIAATLKQAISTGVGVKATNSDAIAGLRLAAELKGHLKRDNPDNLTQNNYYLEFKGMDAEALAARVAATAAEVAALQQ